MAVMDERLMTYLDDCLASLRSGESLERCVARYPEQAKELRALLQIALALEELPQPEPSGSTTYEAKSRFLAEAERKRAMYQRRRIRHRLANAWSHVQSRLGLHTVFSGWMAPARSIATVAITLALVLLIGGGIVHAASGSIPGDPLYGFKLLGEDVQRALAWSQESRTRLETTFNQRRLDEVQQLLTMERKEDISFGGLLQARSGNDWIISNVLVTTTQDTHLQSEPSIGTFVEVRGTTGTGGSVTARRIDIQGEIIIGRIRSMLNNDWQVAAQTIWVNDHTLGESSLEVEDCVQVLTRRLSDGTLLALEIERGDECDQEESDETDETAPTLTPTPTPSPSATEPATSTPTRTPTATPSPTWTSTPSPTPTVAPPVIPEKDEPTATIQPPPSDTSPSDLTPTATEEANDDDEENDNDNDNEEGGNENSDDSDNSDSNDNENDSDDGEDSNDDDRSDGDANDNNGNEDTGDNENRSEDTLDVESSQPTA
jgi:hypothetical protein